MNRREKAREENGILLAPHNVREQHTIVQDSGRDVDVQYLVDTEDLPANFTTAADNLMTEAFHTLMVGGSPSAAIHSLFAFLGIVQRDEGDQLASQQAVQLSNTVTPIIALLQSS